MQRAIHLHAIATITLIAVVSAQPAVPGDASGMRTVGDPGGVAIRGATPVEREMVDWALGRFEGAGLQLPSLKISFHDDRERCRDFIGLYRAASGAVLMCNRGGEKTAPAHTLLHELGHAWADNYVDDPGRAVFMDLRGVEHWTSADPHSLDPAWWQRGYEHAAEIMAWGLAEGPFKSRWLHTDLCTELADAFRLLTGADPLNRSTAFCKCQEPGSIYLQACPLDAQGEGRDAGPSDITIAGHA